MTITEKIKTVDNKILTEKLLRLLLYHQEMSVDMNFYQRHFTRTRFASKSFTIKIFKYLLLGKELKVFLKVF